MLAYIVRRSLGGILVLLLVSAFVFALVRFIPGDAAMSLLGEKATSQAQIDFVRHKLGLDQPIHVQFLVWLGRVVKGDLGESLFSGDPVVKELAARAPITLQLTVMASIISIVVGVPIGIISAIRQDSLLDYVLRVFAILNLAIPSFWLGLMLIVFPSIWFDYTPPLTYISFWENPLRNLQQFLFPSLALGLGFAASLIRMARSSLLEVLRQDYIRTAWAKGLKETAIVARHALKPAMIPVVTIWAVQFGFLLSGTIIIETVFALPGMGRLTYDAIFNRDYTQIQGNVLIFAVMFVAINLLVDVLYGWLDPRIRYS